VSVAATLGAKLDAGDFGDRLIAALQGPLGRLGDITLPADPDTLTSVSSGGPVDLSSIERAVGDAAARARTLLAELPIAGDVLAPLTASLDVIESVTADDFAGRAEALLVALGRATEGSREGGLLGVLQRLALALGEAREGRAVLDLARTLAGQGGIEIPTLPVGDTLAALDGGVRALGGLLAMDSVLADAESLTAAMAAQLDADAIARDVATLEQALDGGPVTLPAFVAGVAADDPAAVAAAVDAVAACAALLETLDQRLRAGMGLGEATLVYLDVDRVLAEVELAAALARGADLDPLGRQAASLAAGLAPFIGPLAGVAPPQSLDALITQVEAELAGLATELDTLDVAALAAPLAEGIATITGLLDELAALIARVTVAFQSALATVRDTMAALPLEAIGDALRALTAPITALVEAITTLVGDIRAALDTAATATVAALDDVEGAVDTFKADLGALFAEAKTFVDGLHLDQVLGQVADRIQAFADVLDRARMEPYFDTAADAIGTAADVIAAVPFGLLPDSMKAEVDAAVRPIKEADARAIELEIEQLLGIGEDGTFALRGDIEQAVAGIQQAYDQLIATVRAADPRAALAGVDAKLQEVAARIREISPSLTLAPVQEAIDRVKAAIAAIDLDRVLDPVRGVFGDILGAIEAYRPSTLVGGAQARVAAARQAVVDAVRLAEWAPALDDLAARTLGLLDRFDPQRLGRGLEQALGEVQAIVDRFPGSGPPTSLGGVLVTLMRGFGLRVNAARFEAVAEWIGGASGSAALAARATRISDAVTRTRDGVAALDLGALTARIVQRVGELQAPAAALQAALPADAPARARLAAAMARLNIGDTLGALDSNRARYLAMLSQSATAAETLRRTGFSDVDVTLANLRTALGPLASAADTLRRILGALGLGVDGGVAGVLRSLLAVVSPPRLTGVAMPLFVALRGRLTALLTAILTPLRDGIAKLRSVIDAIDLAPLSAALDSVFEEVRAQILALHPDQVLAEPLAALRALQQAIVAQDPLAPVIAIVTAVRDAVARVAGKLDLTALLETPLAIYDSILAALAALDVRTLIEPVLAQLDEVARQVDDGLDRTVTAFKDLQAALPDGAPAGA
jgi:hypothetical protein